MRSRNVRTGSLVNHPPYYFAISRIIKDDQVVVRLILNITGRVPAADLKLSAIKLVVIQAGIVSMVIMIIVAIHPWLRRISNSNRLIRCIMVNSNARHPINITGIPEISCWCILRPGG